MRIAWAPTLPGVPVASALRARVEQVATALASAGARVDQTLPDGLADHRGPWTQYFASFLRTARALYPDMMGPGAPLPAESPPNLAEHARTLSARDAIIRVWEAFLGSFDALLLPVAPCVAPVHGPPGSPLDVDGVDVESWRIDHLLYPFSFTGQPTAVIPAGVDDHGLPIGVQLVGRRWDDEPLLAVAACVDRIVDGYRRPPGY